MMCDRCHQSLTAEEAERYEVPGATGPGVTLHLHKEPCSLPASARPTPYPRERRY